MPFQNGKQIQKPQISGPTSTDHSLPLSYLPTEPDQQQIIGRSSPYHSDSFAHRILFPEHRGVLQPTTTGAASSVLLHPIFISLASVRTYPYIHTQTLLHRGLLYIPLVPAFPSILLPHPIHFPLSRNQRYNLSVLPHCLEVVAKYLRSIFVQQWASCKTCPSRTYYSLQFIDPGI